jgi:acyl-CoA reductase-like NAD-dependent aldehyde dehydrogenase
MLTEWIIVVKDVAEEFFSLLRSATAQLQGDAGYAVTTAMAQKAQKLMSDATDKGATFLIGSNQSRGSTGAALELTFLTRVRSGNPIHDLETFGQSASAYVVNNEEEAIQVANDSSYGLTGAIHMGDILKGLRLAQKLEVELVVLNSTTMWDEPPTPLGGMKSSGWGKNNSRFAVEEILFAKAVAVAIPPGFLLSDQTRCPVSLLVDYMNQLMTPVWSYSCASITFCASIQ